jgi:DNA-binding GntR family transcriptional regulator
MIGSTTIQLRDPMNQRDSLYRDVKQQITEALRSGKVETRPEGCQRAATGGRLRCRVGTVRRAIEAENIWCASRRGTFVDATAENCRRFFRSVARRLPGRTAAGLAARSGRPAVRASACPRSHRERVVSSKRFGARASGSLRPWCAEELITAVAAGEREAGLLGVAQGAPLLRIQRVAYTYKDVAVDARVRLVNSSQHAYASVLGSRA